MGIKIANHIKILLGAVYSRCTNTIRKGMNIFLSSGISKWQARWNLLTLLGNPTQLCTLCVYGKNLCSNKNNKNIIYISMFLKEIQKHLIELDPS